MEEPANPPETPPEQKPTPNQQAIEDLSWDIPFFRTVWNFFVREGNAVKNGWLAVLIMVGIAVFVTHDCTKEDADSKVSELMGQLSDAKQDRDKYQIMLAPFEAFALAKYTNAPIEERLTMLTATMNLITNALANSMPIIHLEINGQKIKSFESPKVGDSDKYVDIPLNTNRQISLEIFCDSDISAENISVDFASAIAPTNILARQWVLEPKSSNGFNHWHLVATDSCGALQSWMPQTIVISQNFKQSFLPSEFLIHADRSKTWIYSVNFIVPQ